MKKLVSLLLCVVLALSMMPTLVLNAWEYTKQPGNPYGNTQTIDGIVTVPCTTYAWDMAYINSGVSLPSWGNAGNWWTKAQSNSSYQTGSTPKPNSIVVWTGGLYNFGHVAYVTAVNGSSITIKEGGNGSHLDTGGVWERTITGTVGTATKQSDGSYLVIAGYIYLCDHSVGYDNLGMCKNCGAVKEYIACLDDAGVYGRSSSYSDTIFIRESPYSGDNKASIAPNGLSISDSFAFHVYGYVINEQGNKWYVVDRAVINGKLYTGTWYTYSERLQTCDDMVAFGKYAKYTIIGTNDATLGATLDTVSGKLSKVTEEGVMLYNSSGTLLKKFTEHYSFSDGTGYMWYECVSDLGVTLNSGTTYKYKFYAINDGKTYYSDMYSFTAKTNNSISITPTDDKEQLEKYWLLETNGCMVMKIESESTIGTVTLRFTLNDESGNYIAHTDETVTLNDKTAHAWYEFGADLGVTLTAGTTYKYQMSVTRGSNVYYSDMITITTRAHNFSGWISNGGDWCYRKCSNGCNYEDWVKHPFGSWTDDGGENHKAVCANCGHIKWESHTYGTWTRVGNNHTRSCTVCGHTQTEAHNYSAWSDDGEINHIATCSDCGYSKYSAHTYGSWVDDGSKNHKQTCSVCNHYNYADHKYDSGVITTEPGCETTGVKTYTCSVCSKTKTETVAATGHNYSSWTKISDSEHQRVCSKCSSVEKKSHTWDDGVITTPATHTQEGVKTYTCSGCNGTRTEAIDRITDHSYGQWQSYDDNQHVKSCVCGHSLYEAHTWDSGKITTAPTTTTEGERTFTCSECGGKKYVAIPPISEPIPENALLLSISDATASAGNRVSVAISVSNNPGFISMMLRVSYPTDVLTLVEVQDTGLIPGDTHSDSLTSPYTLTWNNDDTATANITTNGTLVYLVFEVADDAAEGTYEITASVPSYGILDYYADNVVSAVDAGSVTVIDYILGDVDSDGEVTPRDRMILARYLGDFEGYGADRVNFSAADIDCDGEVTPRDRMLLARHLAGMTGYESLDSFRK